MRRFPGRFAASVLAGVLLLLLGAGSAAPSAAAITSENYVIWGAGGVDPGHFYGAHGIAVGPYGDLVYVADTGNNRIEAFTPEGIYLYKWGHFGKVPVTSIDPSRSRPTPKASCMSPTTAMVSCRSSPRRVCSSCNGPSLA